MTLCGNEASDPDGEVDLALVRPFPLGALAVDPARLEVQTPTGAEILQPRVMQVLVVLAAEAERVVSRDELGRRCWGGRVVGEDALNRCVGRLRQLSSAHPGQFSIETVPRVGYRLRVDSTTCAEAEPPREPPPPEVLPADPVQTAPEPQDAPSGRPSTPPPKARSPSRGAIVLAAVVPALLLLGLALAWIRPGRSLGAPPAPLRTVAILPVRNLTGDPHLDAVAGSLTEDVAHLVGRSGLITVLGPAADAAPRGGSETPTGAPSRAAYVVRIDLRSLGSARQLDLRVADAATGRILDTAQQVSEDPAREEQRVALRLYSEIFQTVVDTWRARVLKAGRGDDDPETLLARIIGGLGPPPADPAGVQALVARAETEIRDPGALATAQVAACYQLVAGIGDHVLAPASRRRLAEAALADADQAVAARPLTASSHACAAAALAELGRWDEALAADQFIIDNVGVTADGYLEKADVELRLGRYADAVRDYSEYAERIRFVGYGVSGEPPGLGLAYLLSGDAATALTHLQRTLAADPTSADARLYEAAALEALGRRAEALAAAREFTGLKGAQGAWSDFDAPVAPKAAEDFRRVDASLQALGLRKPSLQPA